MQFIYIYILYIYLFIRNQASDKACTNNRAFFSLCLSKRSYERSYRLQMEMDERPKIIVKNLNIYTPQK